MLAEAAAARLTRDGPDDPTPPIVRPPSGAEVDGRRLLGEAVGFGRALRAAGWPSTSARRSTSPGR